MNSYGFCSHHFRRTHRSCTHTIRVSPSLKSCSLCRRTFIHNLRHSCGKGIRALGHLVSSCPRSRCVSSTLCRRKHTFIRVRSGTGTVTHFGVLIGGFPRDGITQQTTGRVNLLCCRSSGCPRTVRTCGRIVTNCPNDRRTHLTRHSLGSVCVSLGGISRCTGFTSAVPNNTGFSIGRHSSLACITTREMCVQNRITRTHGDFAHCLRAFPRNTFDLGTGCCVNLVSCGRGTCRDTTQRLSGMLRCPGGGCSRSTVLVKTRVTCATGSCRGTLRVCGRLGSGTTSVRHHQLTGAKVLHDTRVLKGRRRVVFTTASLLTSAGLTPRLSGRTRCCHTGTCLSTNGASKTVRSLGILTGSAHGMCKTRTGCGITRVCFSNKRASGTRRRILGCVRMDAPRAC